MQFPEPPEDVPRVSLRSSGSFCTIKFPPFLVVDGLSRKSLSYNKLPQEPIKLCILKLDGSSFGIEVVKTATIAELKQAVEAVFSHITRNGTDKVSWSHVWGHFCLSFDGQKLLTDAAYIGNYGIKDGDQLRFIRHVSINYNIIKTRSRPPSEEPSISDGCGEREESSERDDSWDEERENHIDEQQEHKVIKRCEHTFTRSLRGWFSYRRLTVTHELRFQRKNCSSRSRFGHGFLGRFKNMVSVCSNKYSTRIVSMKAE